MSGQSRDRDVIVIVGGIAGLGAAVRLKDRGLEPLVLEAELRVGGRMTTDRVNGFVVDRGVTLFGNAFGSMRALVRRLGLSPLVCKGQFSVGIQDAAGCRGYRSPEAAASQVKVLTEARALHVEQKDSGVHVEAEVKGKQQTFQARAVIFAIPGQVVPLICPGLPADTRGLLSRTRYSRIANAAVALSTPPKVPYAGYAFREDV